MTLTLFSYDIFLPFKKCLWKFIKKFEDGAEDQFYYSLFSSYYFYYSRLFCFIERWYGWFLLFQLFALVLFICLIITLEMALILKSLLSLLSFSYHVLFLSGTLEGEFLDEYLLFLQHFQIGYFNSKEKNSLYSYICHFKFMYLHLYRSR